MYGKLDEQEENPVKQMHNCSQLLQQTGRNKRLPKNDDKVRTYEACSKACKPTNANDTVLKTRV